MRTDVELRDFRRNAFGFRDEDRVFGVFCGVKSRKVDLLYLYVLKESPINRQIGVDIEKGGEIVRSITDFHAPHRIGQIIIDCH